MSQKEVEDLVVSLAKEGHSPAKIGLILRDKHGIPRSKIVGKKVGQILRERGIEFVTDKQIVDGKIERMKTHVGKNKHDYTASRALTRKMWDLYHLERAK